MPQPPIRTVSGLWIRALLLGAEHQGLERQALMDIAGIDDELLAQPYCRVSLDQTLAIWRAAESLSPSLDFGLLMGEQVKPSHFQLFALSLMHSETLASALEKSNRYTRLVSDGGGYHLQVEGDQAAIIYQPAMDSFSRHQIDAVLVLLRNFANWLTCKSLALTRVEFIHPQPADVSHYQRIFNAPLQFSSTRNALVFPVEILQEPLAFSDQNLAAVHEQMLEQQLAALDQPDVVRLLEQMLRNALELSFDREDVARHLNISSRTLQRKLQEAGTSFQVLLEQERKQRAEHLLAQAELSLTTISQQLGFAESSAFSRAFKRWWNMTPLEFRQKNHSSPD